MKKVILTISAFCWCLQSAPSHAQYGIGGELVYDPWVEAQEIIQIAKLVEEIRILNEQLNDMVKQATIGLVPWNTTTEHLVAEIMDYTSDTSVKPILYGHEPGRRWPEVFPEHTPVEDGTWLEGAKERELIALQTQRDLLEKINMRAESMDMDAMNIRRAQGAADGATGRNQLIKAQAALTAQQLWQDLEDGQVAIAKANMEAVAHGQEINDRMQREEQERYFLNGGKPLSKPTYEDRGL